MKCTLKLRNGIYSNGSGNCTYNTETGEAISYKWWSFVKVIKGKVIFNAYRYSVMTSGHQYAVRRLLREVGISIDLEVEVSEGLQTIDSIKDLKKADLATKNELARVAETKRLARLKRARELRAIKKASKKVLDDNGFVIPPQVENDDLKGLHEPVLGVTYYPPLRLVGDQ